MINTNNIICSIDTIEYNVKPQGKYIGAISNRLIAQNPENNLENIMEAVSKGISILPFKFSNTKRSKYSFEKCNMLLLDFDNKETIYTIEDCLENPFTKEYGSFLYESLSSTEEKPKFRLAFLLDFEITNSETFTAIYRNLLEKYPQADSSCNDCSRLFFGGKSLTVISKTNKIKLENLDVSEVTLTALEAPIRVPREPIVNYSSSGSTTDIELIQAFKELNKEYLAVHFKTTLTKPKFNKTYDTIEDFLIFFNKLNMNDLFKLPKEPFKCIITPENNPSCSVLYTVDKNFVYKRFSEDCPYNLNNFQLISKLSGESKMDIVGMLLEILGSEVLQIENKSIAIKSIENLINDTSTNYVNTKKLLGKRSSEILDILNVMFLNTVTYNTSEYISVPYVAKLAEYLYGATSSDAVRLDTKKKKINSILYTLSYLGIITNLKDEELDVKLKVDLYGKKTDNRKKNRANSYRLNLNVTWDSIEKLAERLVTQNITVSKMSVDVLLLLEDDTTLKDIVYQSKKERATSKLVRFKSDLSEYISNEFPNSRKYIFVNEINTTFCTTYGKKFLQKHLGAILISLEDTFNYKVMYLTKELRENLNINTNKREKILLFN